MTELLNSVPIDPGELRDSELELELVKFAQHQAHRVPTYYFRMIHGGTRAEIGGINLRIASTLHIERYAGHVGYSVYPEHQGHHYAARALRLLLPLASRLKINPLWVTCDPENKASQRTLELAGAQLIEVVDVPADCVIFQSGKTKKCRYRLSTA